MLATTSDELLSSLRRLGDAPIVGVDVERADSERYWRRPALIQLGLDGTVILIDPLGAVELSILSDFLAERTVVLHAMDNDIAPLAGVGVDLADIEDTAVAAAVLGLPTGLEALLDQLLGVRFNGSKQRMQRADWSRRPMTEAMLDYAAADVADLLALWRVMRERLDDVGRWTWYSQERDAVRAQPPLEDRRDWTRLRGLRRLSRRAQTRARALWQAREALARDTDTAPNRIVTDRVLLTLATTPPTDLRQLRSAGVRRQAARAFGEQLLRALNDAEEATPVPAGGRRFDDRDRAFVDELRTRRSRVAAKHAIDPGVLCPNRTLEHAVARRPATPDELRDALDLRPWQWALLADDFADALATPQEGTPGSETDTAEDGSMADVLNPDALHHEIDRLEGWSGTSTEGISKQYTFDDFAGSIAFVNRVAEQAERADHHPDLTISWNTVTVTYVTHSAGGVTQSDVEQARAIDGLPV